MTPPWCERLIAAVQTNCHIADARHAADMTLCTYLLQMREFHRWERGLGFAATLARDEVGAFGHDDSLKGVGFRRRRGLQPPTE